MQFRGTVAGFINTEPPWNTFIAMFILFIVTSLGIWIAFGFVKRWIEQWHLKTFDKQAGALLGALKGALLCIVITLFAVTLLERIHDKQSATRILVVTSRTRSAN